ncbi:MAG: hypothetical protein IT374_24480 [Polyangiaceae bacterium]|nr:hypothetical protein [Polyangiaceae bacterium]
MAKLSQKQIRDLALEIVRRHAGGIRYGELARSIETQHPETPRNTIQGSIWNLDAILPNDVAKPSRGLFMPLAPLPAPGDETARPKVREQDFYEPFAEWLKNDLDEVTDVVALGGAVLKGKWGTPDVLGVYKPLASNLIKFPLEIVSAEVKTDPGQPVVAFGQAVAYRLFSAKTYIAMPAATTEEDKDRLEALCTLFGVGLVLFDLDPKTPQFSIRMRAQRFSPDMFYVNELADRLRLADPDTFEILFR